jgi:uncharacterized protein
MQVRSHLLALSLVVLGSTAAVTADFAQSQSWASPDAEATMVSRASLQPGLNRVMFQSEGKTLVGHLYLPASYQPGDQLPAVVVAGSWTTVKEQMAGTYAAALAEKGYAALAFDFRGFGESEGNPRNYESPATKVADIKNAVSFLQSVDAVDADRIAGLGICASAGYMAVAVAEDDRIRSLVAIAPWIHDAAIVNAIYGGEAAVQQKIAAAQTVRTQFEQTGQMTYVPAISTTDPSAAMFGEFDYYLNPERGAIPEWDNQFAVMSWAEWLTFSAMPQAAEIQVPTLFIHSEAAAIPDGARQFFASVPTPEKDFIWLPERTQFDFYDQEATIQQSVDLVADHLQSALQ